MQGIIWNYLMLLCFFLHCVYTDVIMDCCYGFKKYATYAINKTNSEQNPNKLVIL